MDFYVRARDSRYRNIWTRTWVHVTPWYLPPQSMAPVCRLNSARRSMPAAPKPYQARSIDELQAKSFRFLCPALSSDTWKILPLRPHGRQLRALALLHHAPPPILTPICQHAPAVDSHLVGYDCHGTDCPRKPFGPRFSLHRRRGCLCSSGALRVRSPLGCGRPLRHGPTAPLSALPRAEQDRHAQERTRTVNQGTWGRGQRRGRSRKNGPEDQKDGNEVFIVRGASQCLLRQRHPSSSVEGSSIENNCPGLRCASW